MTETENGGYKSAEEAAAAAEFNTKKADENNQPVRPGGELVGKPVQGSDGTWRDKFGERISAEEAVDRQYADQFWQKLGKEKTKIDMKSNMMENLATAAKSNDSQFRNFVTMENGSLTEPDKERLSAYRQLGRENGYQIGSFQFHPRSGNVSASIKKVS